MYKYILPALAMLFSTILYGQQNFRLIVKDKSTQEAIAGATIKIDALKIETATNNEGRITLSNIPPQPFRIELSHTGYEELDTLINPSSLSTDIDFILFLEKEEEELEDVIISTTRTGRSIQNVPTRIEVIDFEEIDEKNNMRPSNVSMLLHESTGIQVQQTSATSANLSIRIQGLDGRYTQLLKDGFTSFGNFSGGLSILEIPPLDLKQVEIIKGPASPLYGGGAIAGVVNFITKTPKDEPEYSFLINQSNIGQTNIGGYAAARYGKIGYTLMALGNVQKSYDVDNDHFSEMPKAKDFSLIPKLYFYPNNKTTIALGHSYTGGTRTGGDMQVIKSKPDSEHTYFEKNITSRNNTTLSFETKIADNETLNFKSGISIFNRKISLPSYAFEGKNVNSFNDLSYLKKISKHTLIFGMSYMYDRFNDQKISNSAQDFTTKTLGLYAQHTIDITEKIVLENGLRIDKATYGNAKFTKNPWFVLPRISLMYKPGKNFTTRIGGGLGYKLPTLFTEQTESMQYQNLLPLENIEVEKSIGGTIDFNYKYKPDNDFVLSINQMFFYTKINNTNILAANASGDYFFKNATKPIISKGFETNLKLIYKDNFKLFTGFTFTDAKAQYLLGNKQLLLLAKNKLNLALIYEKERDLKIGIEGYYTGSQYTSNGGKTPTFWEFGAMAEKTFGKVALFINFENFTDTRQSRYKPVVNGSHSNPSFDEIWTHTEGRALNGGIKVRI